MDSKIVATVVLYNYTEREIENIYSYIDDIDVLYAIDNSEGISDCCILYKLTSHVKIKYISFGHNKGIAYALNYASDLAIKDGYQWLLTLDQDSKVSDGMIKEMHGFINSYKNINTVGIVAARVMKECAESKKYKGNHCFVPWVYTSGNLINLQAYSRIGKFNEGMFIDYVDMEYCFRLRKNDYNIIVLNNAVLIHNVGQPKGLFFGKFIASTHSSKRYYSMARNVLYVSNLHKNELPTYLAIIFLIRKVIKIMFWENEKSKKINNMILGIKHYKQQKKGKCKIAIEMFYSQSN